VSPGGEYPVLAALDPPRDESAFPAIRETSADELRDELAYVRYRLEVLVDRRFLRPFTVAEAEQYRHFGARELRLLDALGHARPAPVGIGIRLKLFRTSTRGGSGLETE
jgi:hypothetical protein